MKLVKVLLFLLSFGLSSCATLCGGARYKAEVVVDNHPSAEIQFNNECIGTGSALVKIKRRDADNVHFLVKEGGKEQLFSFYSRRFRGWAFVGTLCFWDVYGVIVDGITGAWWKPNKDEPGVTKLNNKRYRYNLQFHPEQ